MTKKLLLIAAVAVMLVGATNAYGDDYSYESWDGWFNDGYIGYDKKTYEIVESVLTVDDYTLFPSDRDTFGFWMQIPAIAFVCAAGENDSIFVYIHTFTGGKEHGYRDTYEGAGFWSGSGYSERSHAEEDKLFDFGGTWEATFDYTPLPHDDPTCEGTWMVTWSGWPVPVGGIGSSSGERTYYRRD